LIYDRDGNLVRGKDDPWLYVTEILSLASNFDCHGHSLFSNDSKLRMGEPSNSHPSYTYSSRKNGNSIGLLQTHKISRSICHHISNAYGAVAHLASKLQVPTAFVIVRDGHVFVEHAEHAD
jgi:hypothetical protein